MFEIEKIIIIIILNAKYLSNYEQWHACNEAEIKEKIFFQESCLRIQHYCRFLVFTYK